jgi:pyridoxal phosphate-dependent aminotransferase EpsN
MTFMPQAPYGLHTNWLSCFLVDEERCRAGRDAVIAALAEKNIEARPLWKPMHLQPVFRDHRVIGGAVAEDLFARGLCLPSGSGLTQADRERVISAIRDRESGHGLI